MSKIIIKFPERRMIMGRGNKIVKKINYLQARSTGFCFD